VVAFLHRWLFVDFFVPVWPNIAASALLALHIKKSNQKHMKFYIGDKPGDDDEGH